MFTCFTFAQMFGVIIIKSNIRKKKYLLTYYNHLIILIELIILIKLTFLYFIVQNIIKDLWDMITEPS